MTGNPEVISTLKQAISAERHMNLQMRQDKLSLKFLGAKKLAGKVDGFADDEHYFYQSLTKRMLLLGGDPSTDIAPTTEADSLTGLLQNLLDLEMAVLAPYEQAIQTAMRAMDDGTRNLFEHLVKWHQKHVAWLEVQVNLIAALGEQGYLAEKL